jgi:hypothetical protein
VKKIILSMLIVVLLATASSAGVVVIKTIGLPNASTTIMILCVNGYQYILTKYCCAGQHTMTQSFEEKDGRSIPIKCNYK